MNLKKETCIFFIFVLALEIAGAPFVLAQGTGTTTQLSFDVAGFCEINEMTPEQTRLFWDQTYRFRAEEINSLPEQEQLKNKPSQNVVNIYNIVEKGSGVYPFNTIARFIGLDEKEAKKAAESIGKSPSDRITLHEARELAKKYGKSDNEVENYLLSLRGSTSEETPAFENYKAKLINTAEIPVKSLQRHIEQTKACMLNSAHIQGRVSYAASLDNDVSVSFDRAASQLKKNNRVWSSETNADLELHGANTLVIPKHYEELVKKLKVWMMTDVLLTIAQTTVFFGGKRTIERYQDKLKEIEQRAVNFKQDTFITTHIGNDVLKREVYALGSRKGITKKDLMESVETMENEMLSRLSPNLPKPPAGATKEQVIEHYKNIDSDFAKKLDPLEKVRKEADKLKKDDALADDVYESFQNQLTQSAGFLPDEVVEIQKSKIRLRHDREYAKTLEELNGLEYQTDLAKIKRALQRRTGQVWFRIMLGMAWLGPGRFIFELTDAVNFQQVGGKEFGDNYITVLANDNDVAGEFRRASNWMLSGAVTDILSDLTEEGIPTAAYWVGNLFFINQPVEETSQPRVSVTSFKASAGKWDVTTSWQGKSDLLIAEELNEKNEYARLPLEVKGKTWNLKIRAKQEFAQFYDIMKYVAPLLSWRILGFVDYSLTAARLVAYDYYVTDVVNPSSFKKGEQCSMEEIDGFVEKYKALTIANQVIGWAPVFTYWYGGLKITAKTATSLLQKTRLFTGKFFDRYVETIIQVIDPISLAQGYYAAEALEYASACKDDQYTIVAFQSLKKKAASSISEKLKGIALNDFVKNLNIGKAAFDLGQEVDTASLDEYTNLKAELNDQSTHVNADKLYYASFKDASIEWIPSLSLDKQPEACQHKCLAADNQFVCIDPQKGTEKCDKKTGKCTTIASPTRSANHKEVDNFAATIIPNKYITTTLAGCPGSVFRIDGNKNLFLTASQGCAGAACLKTQLESLTGRSLSSGDLTSVLGRVTRIYTTNGAADVSSGVIRFNAFNSINEEVELRSPSIAALEGTTPEATLKGAAGLVVNGDGKTLLQGYVTAADQSGEVEVGELRTIMTERGRINYLGGGQVEVFLHVLSQVDASVIKQINTAPVQKDQCDEKTPGIKITRVEGHTGIGDAAAAELNAALEKIQGCSGMQILETSGKKFIFTTDENGNPVLRVIDKKTGESTDYKITGPLRQDGKDIIVPTDKGDIKFSIDMNENGQPVLSTQWPDGLKEILPLLKANGFGGVLLFDPRTGQWGAFNGQDLSMNPNFASKGQTYSADANRNVRGLPIDDLMFPSRRKTTGTNALASLPSWPTEFPALALLIIITLAGIAIVRWKK